METSGHSWGHLKPLFDRRWIFSGFGCNLVSVGNSLACPKIGGRPCEGLFSCWICMSILPLLKPSWGHLVKSRHLRLFSVWSSVLSGIFLPHEDNMKELRCCPNGLGSQDDYVKPYANAFVQPLYYSTMTSRWDHGLDDNSRIWIAKAFPMWHGNMVIRASTSVCTD